MATRCSRSRASRVDICRSPAGTLHAVRDVSFAVDRGETLCLVGESGCGKSMTALAIMDLLPRQARARRAARLDFAGRDLADGGERDSALRGNRDGHDLPGADDVAQPGLHHRRPADRRRICRHKRGSRGEARDARRRICSRRSASPRPRERLRQYPHQLSGGLRQRVMIAMALMCDPELLIADEPTTALDVTIQAQILRLLADLQREFGMALVLITHDLGIVARIADRVAVMYAGEIVETASAQALFRHPRHPYTRGLLGCIPVPGRTRPGERLGTIPGMVPSLVGELRGCAFRDRCGYRRGALRGGPALRIDAERHAWRCILEAA